MGTTIARAKMRRDTDLNLRDSDIFLQGELEFAYDAQYLIMHDGSTISSQLPRYKGHMLDALSANKTYIYSDPETDIYVTAGSGSDIVVTMPQATTVPQRWYRITKVDTGTAKVDIQFSGASQANGSDHIYLSEQYQYVMIRVTSGNNYTIVSQSDMPTVVSDNDISTTNATTDITTLENYPIGFPFRIAWHSGDGSNTHAFTGYTAETIDGIAATQYTGNGTGHLDLVRKASGTFETINAGEIWDSDGGNFTDRTFEKQLSGKMRQTAGVNKNDGLTTAQTFTHALTFASVQEGDIQQDSASNTSMSQFDNLVSTYTASFAVAIIAIGAGTAVSVTRHCTASFDGRWTTSYPRRS